MLEGSVPKRRLTEESHPPSSARGARRRLRPALPPNLEALPGLEAGGHREQELGAALRPGCSEDRCQVPCGPAGSLLTWP